MKDRKQFDFNVDMKEAIEEYMRRRTLIDEAIQIEEFENIPDCDVNGMKFDDRDLGEIVQFMPIFGKDKNEQLQCIRNNYRDIIRSFVSNDKDDIQVYLDIIYTAYDKMYDYYKNGVNTKEDFVNFQFLYSADQTFQMKRREYTEIFYKHYNTPEKLNKFMTQGFLMQTMTTDICRIKRDYPEYQNKGVQPYEMVEEFLKKDREFGDVMIDAFDNKSNIIDISDTSKCIESIDKEVGRVKEALPLNNWFFGNYYTNDITQKELNAGTKSINKYNLVFLDGKPVYDLAKEEINKNFKDLDEKKYEDLVHSQCLKMVQTALAKGDKQVAYAIPKHSNNKIEFSLFKLRPNVEPQEYAELSKHSAFRIKYFNWGPFKIKPSQDVANSLAKSTKYDKQIIEQASKSFNDFVKKGQEEVANKPKEDLSNRISKAKEYLLKAEQIDLQKDTNLEKSNEIEPMKELPKEKEINIEIDTSAKLD